MNLYGLIGYPLTHSFSKKHFTKKFERENILNCSYELFDIASIDLFPSILVNYPNLKGLNVTIPYKKSVLPFLTTVDAQAEIIGAVNTIKITSNGDLKGYNTDYYGFKRSLKPFLTNKHDRALILGTGGASQTVAYVLKELNMDCLFVSRDPKNGMTISYQEVNSYVIKHHHLIINTTPIGMFPNESACPLIDYDALTSHHLLYDLIYNPNETLFLKKGKEMGSSTMNGMEMLQLQAEKAWEIWNS